MVNKPKKMPEEKKKYNYKIKENWKNSTWAPTKWTKEYLQEQFIDLVECAKVGVPYVDNDWKKRKSPVYLKSKLCFHRDYSRDAIMEAVRGYEDKTKDKQFSAFVKEIDTIIENRLFEAGLSKKADASMVRLWLTAKHSRTTDRSEDKSETTQKIIIERA